MGHLRRAFERIGVHREAVVLCRDFYFSRRQVHHWLIATMVTELEFISFAAQGEPHDLVTEAYPENRFLADQLLDVLFSIGNGIGIAGAVGKKNAVGIQGQYVFGRHRRRNYFHLTARLGQVAQNVELDPIIIGHDKKGGSTKGACFLTFPFRD